jgi:hypothetical protein
MGAPSRARVTRDVEPAAVADLLEAPPRAAIAFVEGNEVTVLPALARVENGTHLFGVEAGMAPDLSAREVVLVRDDGPYWFELRGVSVRGIAVPSPVREDLAPRLAWYSIQPSRVLAWDYGELSAQ